MQIRTYQPQDETPLVHLWDRCGLLRPWSTPHKDIALKMAFQPDLLLVGEQQDQIVASVMAGYDGHRGWLNYLAVHPDFQHQGLGREIILEAERRLLALGCPKINVQIRESNEQVMAFYEKIGFANDHVFGMGKRLPE